MPEREWILLNPGPANTSPRVRQALQTPDLCHREPEFFEVMRECRHRLVGLLGIERTFSAVLFTGSGTAAVEAAFTSVVPPERSVLVIDNGVYAFRVSNMGMLTPEDMVGVVNAFAECLQELGG
jgi:2-aminoethylphosphonate-pyruvate transaminase